MLSEQAIKEFQEIYCAKYGEAISFEQAAAQAERLIRLYKTVLKPSGNKGSSHGSNGHSTTTT